jgi:acyl-CoA thioester hydrolase
LKFRFRPVSIECWVTEIRAGSFTVAYEIFHDLPDGGRRVYARASTLLTPYVFATESPRRISREEREILEQFLEDVEPESRAAWSTPRHERVGHYPVHVRFSDVDAYRHVNNVKYFEYFQEARILLNARLWRDVPEDVAPAGLVVAQTDVEYRAPILFRPEPYDSWTWLTHVGRTSAVFESEIVDGDRLLSRSRVAIVFFDPQTQRAAPPADVYREPMLAAVAGG